VTFDLRPADVARLAEPRAHHVRQPPLGRDAQAQERLDAWGLLGHPRLLRYGLRAAPACAGAREYLTLARQPVSLDLRVGDNQDTELRDLLEDESPSPEQYTTGEALRDDVHQLLDELTPQQREVLTLRFGLNNGKELSLAKVGEQLSLSRERVRQLERQALDHLRRRKSNVREYLAS